MVSAQCWPLTAFLLGEQLGSPVVVLTWMMVP